MSIPIEADLRYTVTPKLVKEMKKLKKNGAKYSQIANMFNVSYYVALYWCNDSFREKERKRKIGKKNYPRWNEEKRIQDRIEYRRRNSNYPAVRLNMELCSARNETRCNRKTIHGKPIAEAEAEYKKHKKGGRKID